jgi:maltooligosyltrehalose synthase
MAREVRATYPVQLHAGFGFDETKEVLHVQLTRLLTEWPEVAEALDAVAAEINANPEPLHALLERQNYRLAFWRAAARDLGYQRFFDINSLEHTPRTGRLRLGLAATGQRPG